MRPAALSGVQRPTRFMMEISIRKALLESFNDIYPRKRGGSSWLKFMPVSAVTTLQLGPLLARPFIQVFAGRRPEQIHRTLSNVALDASYSPTKATCPPPLYKRSPSLGLLRSGGSIWSDPLKAEAIRKSICKWSLLLHFSF